MIVAVAYRGRGIGRLILDDLERRARGLGCDREARQRCAVHRGARPLSLAGYSEIPRYNDNPHAELWFEKTLSCASSSAR